MVAPGRGRHLVQERLHHPACRVGAGRAERASGHLQRQQRLRCAVARQVQRRELVGLPVGRGDGGAAFAIEVHQVRVPRRQPALAVERALERHEAARAHEVVLHVVFARPHQLDGDAAGLARDQRRLDHVVVDQAPAEAAADALLVHRHPLQRQLQQPGDECAAGGGRLRRRPQRQAVAGRIAPVPGAAVHRLELGVGDEAVGVAGLHATAAGHAGQRLVHAGAGLDGLLADRLGHQYVRLLGVARPAVLGGRRLVPHDDQLAPRGQRRPGVLRDDHHAGQHLGGPAGAFGDEGLLDAGQAPDLVEVGRLDLAVHHRAALAHGHAHIRQLHVDAVQRLAGDDGTAIDVAVAPAQQPPVLALLQLELFHLRHRQRRGCGGQFAIAQAAAARCVVNGALGRGEFGHRRAPALRGGGQQHRARAGAGLAQRHPGLRHRQRAAGELRAVDQVDRRLLHHHVGPARVQLLGEDQPERGLDVLADLGVLRVQRDATVGRDAHVGARAEGLRGACRRLRAGAGRCTGADGEQQPAADAGSETHEAAA
ncbi:MAG: hypothetical protein LKCHEGNO_01507 [Burkholderiaceae bacterium]|nr:hypothetical protein [Burkholderiaceae bacterium]